MLARQRLTSRDPVDVCQFSYTSPYSPVPAHGADPKFVFGNLASQPPSPPPGGADRAFSDLRMDYRTNFAKFADRNAAGLPNRPAYAGPGSLAMHLDANAAATREHGTFRFGSVAALWNNGRLPNAWRNVNVDNQADFAGLRHGWRVGGVGR